MNDDTWEPAASWLDTSQDPLDGDELELLHEAAARLNNRVGDAREAFNELIARFPSGVIDGDELEPLEEVAARLRSYRHGDLHAYLSPRIRVEQGLHPYILAPADERLVRTILDVGDDPAALDRLARPLDAERLRDLVRRTVAEWNRPAEFQHELHPYVHKHQGDVLWLLERVAIGLTAVEVEISVSGSLPADIPYPDSYPANMDDYDDERYEHPKEWWDAGGNSDLFRLSDDRGTEYQRSMSEHGGRGYPVRVLVDGKWEARVRERHKFLCIPGIPEEARELTLTGQLDLAIEQPSREPMPWPTRNLSLGDFAYTMDLKHWWPPEVDEEYLEYLASLDEDYLESLDE